MSIKNIYIYIPVMVYTMSKVHGKFAFQKIRTKPDTHFK